MERVLHVMHSSERRMLHSERVVHSERMERVLHTCCIRSAWCTRGGHMEHDMVHSVRVVHEEYMVQSSEHVI